MGGYGRCIRGRRRRRRKRRREKKRRKRGRRAIEGREREKTTEGRPRRFRNGC
jgi:hypothetical protein